MARHIRKLKQITGRWGGGQLLNHLKHRHAASRNQWHWAAFPSAYNKSLLQRCSAQVYSLQSTSFLRKNPSEVSPLCIWQLEVIGANDKKMLQLCLQAGTHTNCHRWRVLLAFFPRVRTPCGHDAQVIIEGREIQSDGGEKDKDNPTTNQTKPTTAHRPRLHHQVVFPLY